MKTTLICLTTPKTQIQLPISVTHYTNTSLGWFRELSELERELLQVYLIKNIQEDSVCYELMRLAWSSTAVFSIAPL